MSLRAMVLAGVALVVAVALTVDAPLVAHRTAVSPYTFHRDILPIFESRCARCHADGNVSGVTLLQYPGARLVTWPIRQAVSRGHMPPWFAEGEPAFKAPPPLTARELNVLMTWATGGAPEGKPVPRNPAATTRGWALGLPDLMVPMPSPFTFAGDRRDIVHEVTLPSRQLRGRMIRAVDLLPGTPSIVRRAEILARTRAGEQVIALWQPGDVPPLLEADAAVRVERSAAVVLRMHYRRPSQDSAADRSQIGFYFARGNAARLQAIEVGTGAESYRFPRNARLVGIRPISGPSGVSMRMSIVGTNGVRRLAQVEFQDDWQRRYVFTTPVAMAAGDRIEAVTKGSDNRLWSSLTGDRESASDAPSRIAIEFVW
jgi:hypothetical protein